MDLFFVFSATGRRKCRGKTATHRPSLPGSVPRRLCAGRFPMPRLFSPLVFLTHSLPMLDDDHDSGGGEGGGAEKVKFDDEQQAHVNALVAAERKATEERIRAKLKTESEDAEAAAKTKREQEEAEKRGEFDKVKQGLEGRAEKAEQERDGYKADLDILTTHFETEYTARVKALPDTIWKYHKPADDASLAARIAALTNAEAQAAELKGDDEKKPKLPGNPPNPNPRKSGEGETVDDEAARRNSRRRW